MVGFILGGIIGFSLVAGTWTHGLQTEFGSPGMFALVGVGMGVGGALLGLLFRMTVGVAAMLWMFGATLAAVISIFNGEIAYTGPLVLHAVIAWALQQLLGGAEQRAAVNGF